MSLSFKPEAHAYPFLVGISSFLRHIRRERLLGEPSELRRAPRANRGRVLRGPHGAPRGVDGRDMLPVVQRAP